MSPLGFCSFYSNFVYTVVHPKEQKNKKQKQKKTLPIANHANNILRLLLASFIFSFRNSLKYSFLLEQCIYHSQALYWFAMAKYFLNYNFFSSIRITSIFNEQTLQSCIHICTNNQANEVQPPIISPTDQTRGWNRTQDPGIGSPMYYH